jgi:hypothetical protein
MIVADCSDAQRRRISALEDELDVRAVAFTRQPQLARLSEEELERIRAVEKELGLTLVIYK